MRRPHQFRRVRQRSGRRLACRAVGRDG
jgi:hypothetical protein